MLLVFHLVLAILLVFAVESAGEEAYSRSWEARHLVEKALEVARSPRMGQAWAYQGTMALA